MMILWLRPASFTAILLSGILLAAVGCGGESPSSDKSAKTSKPAKDKTSGQKISDKTKPQTDSKTGSKTDTTSGANSSALATIKAAYDKETDPTVKAIYGKMRATLQAGKRHLYIIASDMKVLPTEIGLMTSLIALSTTANQLTELPPEIGNLTKLTYIHAGTNRIKKLPAEIGKLAKLDSLFLEQNRLTTLPPEIGDLAALTILQLDSNRIKKLPPEFSKLSKLISLSLIGNPIRDAGLEPLKSMKTLQYLSLEKTRATKQGVEALKKALPKCEISSDF